MGGSARHQSHYYYYCCCCCYYYYLPSSKNQCPFLEPVFLCRLLPLTALFPSWLFHVSICLPTTNQCVSSSREGDHQDDWPVKNDSSPEEWERVNGDPFQSSLCALWNAPLRVPADRILSSLKTPFLLLGSRPPPASIIAHAIFTHTSPSRTK